MNKLKTYGVNLALISRTFQALLLISVSACATSGQQALPHSLKPSYESDPASVPVALSKLEKGNYGLADIEVIARWHAVQAISQLEIQFKNSNDQDTKAKIANALLRLGEKDSAYWDFLDDRAGQVLRDEPPSPFEFDTDGKAVPQPSKRLAEWAKNHRLTIQQALYKAMFEAPGAIIELGSSDDARAIPILREALVSENHFIQIQAALGLAELHDTESVPAIIHACATAPKEAAAAIARSLVYFDNPAAQQALDTYVSRESAQEIREARAHGKTPYH